MLKPGSGSSCCERGASLRMVRLCRGALLAAFRTAVVCGGAARPGHHAGAVCSQPQALLCVRCNTGLQIVPRSWNGVLLC